MHWPSHRNMEDKKDLDTKAHKDLNSFNQDLVKEIVQAMLRSNKINSDDNEYRLDSFMKESDLSIAF